jgi:N-formylmaleamate deformylase
MCDLVSGDVAGSGIRIHYYRAGQGGPPVVLNHGLTDDALCWRRLARALSDQYDVVLYDARGHGLSEAPEAGYTPADRVADLRGLLDALRLDRARLIGHSAGADTASWFAAEHPDRVESVVLEDPPWGDTLAPEMADAWRKTLLDHQSRTRADLVALGRRKSPGWDQEDLESWADSKLRASPRMLVGFLAPRPPWQDTLRRIRCPILLVTGDPEFRALVTPAVAAEAATLWNRGRTVRLAGAGHGIHRDRFDAFRDALLEFFAER